MTDGQQLLTQGSAVWRELHGFVYRYLCAHGLSHADAEDLTQDILETAYIHLASVDPERRHAWLITVAKNRLVDRARRSRPVHSVAEVPESADPALGPDEIALQSADRQMLGQAIGRLAERDRQLLELRYLEDRSVVETAALMDMTVSATKVALHRARERLRTILQTDIAGRQYLALMRGEPMGGIAERAVLVLSPYIGRVAADTCVRGTAVSIGKTFDTLTGDDGDELERRVRSVLLPLLPPETIARLIADIRGGAL